MKRVLIAFLSLTMVFACNKAIEHISLGETALCQKNPNLKSWTSNTDVLVTTFFQREYKTILCNSSDQIINDRNYPFFKFNNNSFKCIVFTLDSSDYTNGEIDFCCNPTIIKFSLMDQSISIDSAFEMNKNHIVENIISKYERIKCGYFYALMQKSIYFVLANGCSEILPIFEVRKCLRDNSSKYLWVKCGIIKEDYQPK